MKHLKQSWVNMAIPPKASGTWESLRLEKLPTWLNTNQKLMSELLLRNNYAYSYFWEITTANFYYSKPLSLNSMVSCYIATFDALTYIEALYFIQQTYTIFTCYHQGHSENITFLVLCWTLCILYSKTNITFVWSKVLLLWIGFFNGNYLICLKSFLT